MKHCVPPWAERLRDCAESVRTAVQGLGKVRSTLRERMLASPLCNAEGFVSELEIVYKGLWRRWLEGQAAETES